MLGSRLGSVVLSLVGSQIGSSGDDEGSISLFPTPNILIAIIGQSNASGSANYGATGASDGSYGISDTITTPPTQLDAQWANGGATDPILFSSLSRTYLKAYAPIGGFNMGIEQSLGRYLVRYGIASSPGIIKFAVLGSSLKNHWLPSANFPTNGGKLADQCITYLNNKQAQFGRPIDVLIWIQGEADATDSTSAAAYATNLTTLMTYIRAGIGLPSVPLIVQGLNPNSAATFKATVTSQQATYVASDPNSRLLPIFDLRLNPEPHYDAAGYIAVGDMSGVQVKNIISPGLNTNLGSGPTPWYQQADAAYSCQASSSMTVRSGAETKTSPNDYELLCLRSGDIATTHALSSAAGFTNVVAQFSATFSGNVQSMSVYNRYADSTAMAANQGRMPSVVITPGVATKNVGRIFGFRGVNQTTPINTSVTAAPNTNSATLSIPGGTTTSDNCLMVIMVASASLNQRTISVVNAGFTNIQQIWDGTYNPGSGVTHLALYTAVKSTAGAFGSTTVTFANVNNNVGCIIALQP